MNFPAQLRLHHARLLRDSQLLLRMDTLVTSPPRATCLLGAGGVGKSSLLQALAGSHSGPGPRLEGVITLGGSPLSAIPRPLHVPQQYTLAADADADGCLARLAPVFRDLATAHGWLDRARSLDRDRTLEPASSRGIRKALAVLDALSRPAPLYLVDEPTADMEGPEADMVRHCLRELAKEACVLVATHNRQDCLALDATVVLLAGGTVQEVGVSTAFFSSPATHAGRVYVETGNCNLPRTQPPARGQGGLWWPVSGLLAGACRPNLLQEAEEGLNALRDAGIRHLVCLEEGVPYPMAMVRAAGMTHYHFPVADMAAPSFNQAIDLCRALEPAIRRDEAVALHCRGGLGRTGTGLAALLIWFGDSVDEAIARVRRAQALAIQSQAQLRFLHDFSSRIAGWNFPATPLTEATDVTR